VTHPTSETFGFSSSMPWICSSSTEPTETSARRWIFPPFGHHHTVSQPNRVHPRCCDVVGLEHMVLRCDRAEQLHDKVVRWTGQTRGSHVQELQGKDHPTWTICLVDPENPEGLWYNQQNAGLYCL